MVNLTAGLLGAWLALTLLRHPRVPRLRRWIQRIDPFDLVPIWRFFSTPVPRLRLDVSCEREEGWEPWSEIELQPYGAALFPAWGRAHLASGLFDHLLRESLPIHAHVRHCFHRFAAGDPVRTRYRVVELRDAEERILYVFQPLGSSR